MRKSSLVFALTILSAALLFSGCASMMNMASSGLVAFSEQPSLEVSLDRLGDVEKAADLSNFYMKEAPIGKDSRWPELMTQVDEAYAKKVYDGQHCIGLYAQPGRFIMPLRVFNQKYEEVKSQATTGEYPNFFEAFVALTGEDGKKIKEQNDEIAAKVALLAEKEGRIEELKAKNKMDETSDADKEKNKAEIDKLKEENKVSDDEVDAQFKVLIEMVDALATRKDIVSTPENMALAKNLYTVSNAIAMLQQQAAAATALALIQFARAVPMAGGETSALIERWKAEALYKAQGKVDVGGMMGDVKVKAKKLLKDALAVPGRLGKIKVILGKSQKFNSHVASTLGTLTDAKFQFPKFDASKSQYTGPATPGCPNFMQKK